MSTRSVKNTILRFKTEDSKDNTPFLLKYAPKYYENIEYDGYKLKKHQIYSKIKTLKIIQHAKLKNSSTPSKTNLLLKILKSQRKHIKHLEGAHPSILHHLPYLNSSSLHVQNLSSWRIFLRLLYLESLRLDFASVPAKKPKQLETQRVQNYLQSRFWTHLSRLKHIKHLHLHLGHELDDFLGRFLVRLGTLKELLGSLKSSMIFLNSIEILDNSYLRGFKNILQYITGIKALELSYDLLEKLFGSIGDCQKLSSLSIIKNMKRPEEMDMSINFGFLKGVSSLESLRVLELSFLLDTEASLKSFLESFALPMALTTIKLNFHEMSWKFLKASTTNINFNFESCAELASFYAEWTKLTSLNSLTACFVESDENNTRLNIAFLIPLLKNLPCLAKFYFANETGSLDRLKNPIDFGLLWQAFTHFGSTLKTLYVETPALSLENFEDSQYSEFVALQKCGLCGNISGDGNLPNLFRLFQKGLAHEGKKSQLEVESLLVKTKDSFSQIFQELVHLPRGLIFSIDLNVRNIAGEDFVSALREFLPRIRKENFLKLGFSNVLPNMEFELLKELNGILKENEISKIIKILDKRGHYIYFGDALCAQANALRDEEPVSSSGNGDNGGDFLDFSDIYEDEESEENDEEDGDEEDSEIDPFFADPGEHDMDDEEDEGRL